MLKVIELFAGIGAQRQALKDANIDHEVVAISEIDKYALKAYEILHGKTQNLGDIKAIDELPKADMWTYSFPCTDISLSGRLQGFEKGSNTRSSLLWEVQRLLLVASKKGELPKYLIMENVKNIVSKKFMPYLKEFASFLSSLGYKNFCKVLNSKNYGIPQNRERCFMISILGDEKFVFPEEIPLKLRLKDMLEAEVEERYYLSDKMIKYITASNAKWTGNNEHSLVNKSIASTINTGEGSRRCDASNYIIDGLPEDTDIKCVGNLKGSGLPWDKMHDSSCRVYDPKGLSPTIDTMQGGHRQPKILVKENTKKGYAEAEEGDGVYINRPHQKRGVVQKGIIQTIKASSSDIGVVVEEPLKGSSYLREFGSRGKLQDKEGVCNTLVSAMGTGGGNVPIVEEPVLRVRRLTPKECLRLMGWNDENIDKLLACKELSNTQLYKMAGNSIVVDVLKAIFINLIKD